MLADRVHEPEASAPSPATSGGTYIYCIARTGTLRQAPLGFRSPAVGGGTAGPVSAVLFDDLAAIVSRTAVKRYDISRENTLAHQRVVEEAMTHSEVLPVRFGTVAKSPEQVRDGLLRRRYGELHYYLHTVQDRVELGLKVYWQRAGLFNAIAEGNTRIAALRDAVGAQPPETTHYERIQLGQLVEAAMLRKRDEEAEAILEPLRPLAVEAKVNKILTDTMVLNAAFLVERSQEPAFDAQVNSLEAAWSGRLLFKYAGPLPPYNFVNIVVHWEEE